MKILIASDSYKGSLSSLEVAKEIERGIHDIFPECSVKSISMADGGEGTVESLVNHFHGRMKTVSCLNPLQETVEASYGLFNNSAIIEMASASGLPLVSEKNIFQSNTYGTGQLIKDALDEGCRTIYVGIGGSATNDGGMGMASALGIKFYDKNHCLVKPVPANFKRIVSIDCQDFDKRIKETKIIVMCDVTNPLCGKQGASYIYGPQKGAKDEDLSVLDQGLQHLVDICVQSGFSDFSNVPGSGAAGGLGFGLMTFCGGELKSGIETVLDVVDFDSHVKDCSLVITGEGRIDHQSVYGKVPTGVGYRAKQYNVPTVAIVGCIGENIDGVYETLDGIEGCVVRPCTLEEALSQSKNNVYQATIRLMKAICVGMKTK